MKNFTEILNDEYINKLMYQLLFSGLTEHEIFMFIQYSKPLYKKLQSGEAIHIGNSYQHTIGIVFSGSAFVNNVDYDGNRTVLKTIKDGENSGTLYSMLGYHNALIELVAREETEVLMLNPQTLFITDQQLSQIQQKILVNLIASQRQIFYEISEHIACLSQRSIKAKIIKYLKIQSERTHSTAFKIKYSREELANYLAVDRSALSRAMGELKKDGVIEFSKSYFELLNNDSLNY